MAIRPEFMEAVAEGNQLRVRIMLSNSMVVDPSFRSFDEALAYAVKEMPDLIVPHDGEEFNHDITAWTKDYLSRQGNALVDNFSKERIEFLRGMVAYIYKDRIKAPKPSESPKYEVAHDSSDKPSMSKKQIGTITAGAGAAVAVAGLVMSSTPVAIAGAAVAVVGGVLIVTDK